MTEPRRPYVFHSLSACAECGCTADDFGYVSVEAYEVTGELICEECEDAVLEANDQFGVGA